MAMVVQCSCFLSPGNPTRVSRRYRYFPSMDVAGSSNSLLIKLKKFVSSINDTPCENFQAFDIHPRGSSINQVVNTLQASKNQDTYDGSIETTPQCSTFNQGTFVIQFPVALFLTNALLLDIPLEAMAETCEADQSFFNMPLLLFVSLVGATVGGLLARQRRGELQRVNEQLRQINTALRRQAKIESYAPALSYAPVAGKIPDSEVVVDPRKEELITHLKTGKNYLRNQDPEKAFSEFKAALDLAQNLNDPIEEKKAARGLGASLQRQGKYREAIKYHSMVLSISKRVGEDSGNTEAYGAIADCYTELGDLEKAGQFYDMYIARLETD